MVRPTRELGPRVVLAHGLGSTYTGQVDSLSFKDAIVAATTANITIATDLNVGDAIDGITLADGDRVLVKDQTAAEENGIYVAGTTPERASDMDQSNEILGTVATVVGGTVNGGTTWRVSNTLSTTIDVDDINWVAFGGGSSLAVEDEGTPLATDATTLDFVGGGVTASGTGTTKTITIPGSGGSSLTTPTIVAVGTSATGTGAITPGLPTGHTTNDILLLFVQTDNQAITVAGYAQLGPMAGIGTAAAAGGTRGYVFWKRDGGSETDPTTSDSGDHQLGQIMAIRGCPIIGDPFLNVGAVRKVVASTTATGSAGATPVDNCLVVQAFFHALDSASAVFSSPTNADLGSVTEQIDVATADGNGGGIGVITGTKATTGSFTTTTATMTSGTNTGLAFIMLPAGIMGRAGFIDRQVFITPGVSDTWTRPTGAKQLHVTCFGGGASGSAGRNAATASGGGGGGGAMGLQFVLGAGGLASTATVAVPAGGAATANTDSAASNAGGRADVTWGGVNAAFASGGQVAGASGSGSGGLGGAGATVGTNAAASVTGYGSQGGGGGTGGTTAGAGGNGADFGGGGGAGGGTTQATSAGGYSIHGAGGGGGGRSNTNVGTGGPAFGAGGATAGAVGADSTVPEGGGGGAAGGTSAAGPGGTGGWPGGGGGGGGSQSGAQRGGAGGDGVVVIVTFC